MIICALLASIGLFACKKGGNTPGPGGPGGEGPGGDVVTSDETIAGITRFEYDGGTAKVITYTDESTWTQILTDLNEKVKLTVRPTKGSTYDITGADCNITHTIEFDKDGHGAVGRYVLTFAPKENNSKKIVREVDVEITHKFAPSADEEKEVCSYCGATKFSADEDTIIHYGKFHSTGSLYDKVPKEVYGDDGTGGAAYTNKNDAAGKKSYIKQFGAVQHTNGQQVQISTLSVGQLEPGMTITVKGTAESAFEKWGLDDAGYYFPVIGIADRTNNNPNWDGGKGRGYDSYSGGGTSVFVRGEGWVLYNGIDDSTGKYRMLSALGSGTDGSGESRNYGSHENATHGDKEKVPNNYQQGVIPKVDEWTDWVVYSIGSTSNSGNYTAGTQIELTWKYREDNVIELIYDVNGSRLIAYVKVPTPTTGYYDTMLHGDIVDMHITSYERIETRTPNGFKIEVSPDNYFEGETFRPSTIAAKFQYEQTGSEWFTQALTLEQIFATEETLDTAAAKEAVANGTDTDWVSLATNPVLTKYNTYIVKVNKGGETWVETFTKDDIHVVSNNLAYAAGADITTGSGTYKNYNTVGVFKITTDGQNIRLIPGDTIYGQYIPSDWYSDFENGTVTAAHRYIALQLEALNGTLGAISSSSVPYYYSAAKGELILAVKSTDTTVTINGLNGQTTVEIDLSKLLGFKTEGAVVMADTAKSWYLNNDENDVTFTITAPAGSKLTGVQIGLNRTPETYAGYTANTSLGGGATLIADGTSWNEATQTLVLKVRYAAANLANYEPRTITVYVDGDYDLEYKLDYVPDLDTEADTVDGGYYSFVTGDKIYLAKVAGTAGDDTLGLNVNAGNDNVALLNLAYTYNSTSKEAALKDLSLKGTTIKVINIAGTDIIVIEIDPDAYDISTDAFGYQLMNGDQYSESYYAYLFGEPIEKHTVVKTDSVVLKNGTCLDAGLLGAMNKAVIEGETVAFIANVSEFAGSHSIAKDGAACAYCGQTMSRARFNNVGTLELHDGEFIELTDNFATSSAFDEVYRGVTLKLWVNGDFYWIRNDGFVSYNDYGTAVTDDNFWTSFGEDTAQRTPEGKIDGDGNEITGTSYKATMKAGAAFRIWAGYQDGTFTTVWRMYKKEDATLVTGYGKVYFEFTHKISELTENALKLEFGLDGATNAGNTGNLWWFKGPGKIDKSMIVSAATQGNAITYTIGNIVDHYATVTATGGNAAAMDETAKGLLGITGETKYTKYIATQINLQSAYTTGIATAVVCDAKGNLVEGAAARFGDGATNANAKNIIQVIVALKDGENPGVYYVKLSNSTGSTLQNDIKLDLTAVSLFDVTANVNSDNASIVTGGDIVITYTGADAGKATHVQLDNETAVALSTTMDLGNGVTAAWNSSNKTLTLTVAPAANLTGIPEYTIALLNNNEKLATSLVQLTNLPAAAGNDNIVEVENNEIYALTEGSSLYVYLFGAAATGKDYLVLNANNAQTSKDLILPYSLAYSLSGSAVSFKENIGLTKTGSYYNNGSFAVVQIVIDLSHISGAYYFELLAKEIKGSTTYYTVNEQHTTVSATPVSELPSQKASIADNDCHKVGTKGYEIKNGDTVLGYFGVEVVPSHTWVLHGDDITRYECSVCHAVLASGNVSQQDMPAMVAIGEGEETESIVDTGLTISFVNSNTASGEWDQTISTKGGINFALLCLDPYWNSVSSLEDATQEMKDLAAKLYKTNCWPGMGGGSDVLGSNCFVGTTSYMTITISVTGGIYAYKNGEFAFNYSAEAGMNVGDATDKTGTVADFAKLFLLMVEKYGFTFGTGVSAKDAIVERSALTAELAKERYELYVQESAHLPAPHSHTYDQKGHCVCGVFCTHENQTSGTCSICGATLNEGSATTLANVAIGWAATGTTLAETFAQSTDEQQNSIAFEATYGTCTAWGGLVFLLKDGSKVLYRLRYFDGAAENASGGWGAENGNVILTSGTSAQGTTRTGFTVKALITFYKNGVLRLYVEHWNNGSMVEWREYLISNLAKTSYTIAVNMDDNGSSALKNTGNTDNPCYGTVKTVTATWAD